MKFNINKRPEMLAVISNEINAKLYRHGRDNVYTLANRLGLSLLFVQNALSGMAHGQIAKTSGRLNTLLKFAREMDIDVEFKTDDRTFVITSDTDELRQAVRQVLIHSTLTQKEIAKRCQTSQCIISWLINGDVQMKFAGTFVLASIYHNLVQEVSIVVKP